MEQGRSPPKRHLSMGHMLLRGLLPRNLNSNRLVIYERNEQSVFSYFYYYQTASAPPPQGATPAAPPQQQSQPAVSFQQPASVSQPASTHQMPPPQVQIYIIEFKSMGRRLIFSFAGLTHADRSAYRTISARPRGTTQKRRSNAIKIINPDDGKEVSLIDQEEKQKETTTVTMVDPEDATVRESLSHFYNRPHLWFISQCRKRRFRWKNLTPRRTPHRLARL